MKLMVVYPARAHSAYKIAAETFSDLAMRVFGVSSMLITDEEFTGANDGDITVLIGHDGENNVAAELYLSKKTDSLSIRYCTDDYCIRSVTDGKNKYLWLAGGRPRSTIYAVYRYFELFCSCHWFWDGDRVSSVEQMPFDNIDISESPRFDYRGLRYFAHRSLHRFQAEHWSFEDWKHEIDWMLKKRLNIFMMRMGMDDIWQKAFPEIVSYPEYDKPLAEAGPGYDDRNLFWSLEYRGELRKKILLYAFERDLMHPEDCGTMSHWYSRTPYEFLDKEKPELLPQATKDYSEMTGRVFDIRQKKNFDYYAKLTDTHIKEYGKGEIFHTIGLGERRYSNDPEENKRMKLYVYRKICSHIKEKYPNAPLLIASWDLWYSFKDEEVRSLVSELDPSQSLIFDYTSDTVKENNFTKWDVVNKFPWIFGIFSAFEPNSEIRGFYEFINERIKIAKEDPMCRGLVLWPELSHGDPFAIEYLVNNAWEKETLSISEQTDRYCMARYNANIREEMMRLWRDFMPIVELESWSMDSKYPESVCGDLFVSPLGKIDFSDKNADAYRSRAALILEQRDVAVSILECLAALSCSDELTRRDFYDIARTIVSRFTNGAILYAESIYTQRADIDKLERAMANAIDMLECLTDILSSHEDYSMLSTLTLLQKTEMTNPNFEITLKRNAESWYCRSYIYENAEYLYLPEIKNLFDEILLSAREDRERNIDVINELNEKAIKEYYDTPLSKMKRRDVSFYDALVKSAKTIKSLEFI